MFSMSEQQFGWNYFENEVVIRGKQDKKRMIVVVFSNFMCIPYNRKSFDELVDLLNEQQDTIDKQELRLQHLEELLELSENLNKSYREKLIDMNLKMVIDNG